MNAPHKRPQLYLVDDHPALLEQVSRLLSGEFDILEMLPDGGSLLGALRKHRPDLVVLDISLPDANGIALARKLADGPDPPRIVFLTVHVDSDYLEEALAAGALGYVLKSRLVSDLIPALRAARMGATFISPHPALHRETQGGPRASGWDSLRKNK